MEALQSYLPQWIFNKAFLLTNIQWIGLLATALSAFIIEKIARVVVGNRLVSLLQKINIKVGEKGRRNFVMPVGIFSFAIAWMGGIQLLALPEKVYKLLSKGGEVAFILGLVMTAYGLVDLLALYLEKKAAQTENKLDDVVVPLIRKTLKFFVVAIGIVSVGDALTIDMKGLITGLGIGGLAFAFAAKDTISNLFGSLTVILDQPFVIGDWVIIDGKIEGAVVEVGMRSTRIKTFYDSIISIPNGMLTNVQIDNMGKRNFRRYSTKIGIQYDTPPEKIEAFCEGIRQIIIAHKWTRKDYFHVYFNGLGNSSLDILLYVFWEVPDWNSELNERHRLLLDILRLGNDMGVDFAFPTQTLHLQNQQAAVHDNLPEVGETYLYGKKLAESIVRKPMTMSKPRSGIKESNFAKDAISL